MRGHRYDVPVKPDDADIADSAETLDAVGAPFLALVGSSLASSGEYEHAAEYLQRAANTDPLYVEAWAELARLPGYELSSADVEHVRSIPERVELDGERRAQWAGTLAAVYERAGNVESEWRYLEEMNAALRQTRPDRTGAEEVFFDDVVQHMTSDYFDSVVERSTGSATPIFVFGLPRSGTTLVEQILASHGDVRAGGEMEVTIELGVHVYRSGDRTGSYVRTLPTLSEATWGELQTMALDRYATAAGSAPRLTDKMPSNYRHIGILAALFPDAKYISMRRNPMDVAVSNYRQMYAREQGWSTSPTGLARGWLDHRRLMDHWHEHAPVEILEICYEDFVSDQQAQTERLLEFCELGWDDRCLEFHQQRRVVATASRYQVRQPMYRTSIGAWRRYEPHVAEIEAAMRSVGAPIQ